MVCMHVHVFMKGALKCRIRVRKGIWTEYAYWSIIARFRKAVL